MINACTDVMEGRDPLGSGDEGAQARPAQMYLPEDARWEESELKEALVAQF